MSEQKLTRAEEIAAGRRRRSPSANINGMFLRLGVDPATKDPNYEYRWINDDKGRLQAMTQQDDWDFVANREVLPWKAKILARLYYIRNLLRSLGRSPSKSAL